MFVEIISVLTLMNLPFKECRPDSEGQNVTSINGVSAKISDLLKQFKTIPLNTVLGTVAKISLQIKTVREENCLKILYESFASGYLDTTIDSFGKVPSSLLKGNLKWAGNLDQCAGSSAHHSNNANTRNKYCWLSIGSNNSLAGMSLSSAVCLPSNCSVSAINEYFKAILDSTRLPLNLEAKLSCNETNNLDFASITALCVVAILAFFCFVGTIWDIFQSRETEETKTFCHKRDAFEPNWKKIAYGAIKDFSLCFSVPRSLSSVTSFSGSDQRVSCLDGIRVLSNVWIILGHIYALFVFQKTGNILDALKKLDTWHFQTTRTNFFGVDSFFLLSGFLLTMGFLKSKSSISCGGIVSLYLRRFLRLTPTYAFVVMLYATLLKFTLDGPFWRDGNNISACSTTWFYNLLYISNFPKLNEQCMIWGWYLSVDFQFFLISPTFLIFLKRKNAVLGLVVLFSIFGGCAAISGWQFYTEDIMASLYKAGDNIESVEKNFYDWWTYYTLTYTRIGPFLVGCLLAFVFIRIPSELKMKKIYLVIGWIMAAALNVTVVYGLFNKEIDRTGRAFYNTFARTAFATSVAWLIFVCAEGLGGKVNDILSWKMWIPLGRLTFGSYLLHPLILHIYFGTLRSPFYFTLFMIVPIFLGVSFLSYILSIVLYCLVEYPFSRLQKKLHNVIDSYTGSE